MVTQNYFSFIPPLFAEKQKQNKKWANVWIYFNTFIKRLKNVKNDSVYKYTLNFDMIWSWHQYLLK